MEEPADYADDPSIQDDASLWRRILPSWVIMDENAGEFRPSSAAFDDYRDSPMSVLIENIVTATQRTPADVLRGYDNYSLCSFAAGAARALGQQVATRPKEPDPAHGFVVGKKTRSVKNALRKASRWVILTPPAP